MGERGCDRKRTRVTRDRDFEIALMVLEEVYFFLKMNLLFITYFYVHTTRLIVTVNPPYLINDMSVLIVDESFSKQMPSEYLGG